MKQILFFLLFFQCISIFSQDWQIFHSGRTRFYDKGTKALRVDSTFYQNGDSILKFYNCLTRYYGASDTLGSTFFGKELIIKPNGDQLLYFKDIDTLFFPQNVQINDTWNIISNDSGSIIGKLIQIDTIHAFDYVDSVRIIQLLHPNNFPNYFPIYNSSGIKYYNLDSSIIKISKNNGLYSSSLTLNGYYNELSTETNAVTAPDIRMLIKDVFQNIQVGDKFGFGTNYYSHFPTINGHYIDEIHAKFPTSNSIQFIVNRKSPCQCYNYTVNNISDSLFTSLPNEYPIKLTEPSLWNLMPHFNPPTGYFNGYQTITFFNDSVPHFQVLITDAAVEPTLFTYEIVPNVGIYESYNEDDMVSHSTTDLIFTDHSFGFWGYPFTIPVSCPNCFTNISPSSNSNFSLYPNPSTTSFSIESPSKISKIEIYNLLGSIVLNQNIDKKNFNEINVTELQSGMYVVKVETENGTFSQKWIKE